MTYSDAVSAFVNDRPVNGAQVLDQIEQIYKTYISYPSEHARTAHVLWTAHTHFMDLWESTPRIAFLSPEPGSGKSRALEATEPLVKNGLHCVDVTPAYVIRKVSDPAGRPTLLYDEADAIWGPQAKGNEDLRGLFNAGHRKGGIAGRCTTKGNEIVTEDFPAYSALALAGLGDLPDTVMTRSVVIRMRRRSSTERIEPWRQRTGLLKTRPVREALERWAAPYIGKELETYPEIPPGIYDRDADVWEPLLAVADMAGDHWPQRAREAAVALVSAEKRKPVTRGVKLLADIRSVFTSNGQERLPTEAILIALKGMEDSPWSLEGKELTGREMANLLGKYQTSEPGEYIKPKQIRDGAAKYRGYRKADFLDAWDRYLPSLSTHASDTTDTSVADEPESVF